MLITSNVASLVIYGGIDLILNISYHSRLLNGVFTWDRGTNLTQTASVKVGLFYPMTMFNNC